MSNSHINPSQSVTSLATITGDELDTPTASTANLLPKVRRSFLHTVTSTSYDSLPPPAPLPSLGRPIWHSDDNPDVPAEVLTIHSHS